MRGFEGGEELWALFGVRAGGAGVYILCFEKKSGLEMG